MNEKLSSSTTNIQKIVFPVIWISAFTFANIMLWFGSDSFTKAPPTEMKWMFLFGLFVGTIFLIWHSRRLKHVELNGDMLIVKDYRREIEIPLRNINEVKETWFSNPKLIKLSIYPECEFGDKIVFIPKTKMHIPFGQHPIVKLLKE